MGWFRWGMGKKKIRCQRGGKGPGQCICPACGHILMQQGGQPCYTLRCPGCGAGMARRFHPGALDGDGRGRSLSGGK